MSYIKKFYIGIFFLLILLSIKVIYAQSVGSVNNYQNQINQDNNEINQLQSQESSLNSTLNSEISDKNTILSKLSLINNNIYTYKVNIGKIQSLINNLSSINSNNKQELAYDEKLRNNIEDQIYMNSQTNPIYLFLSNRNFNKVLVNVYLNLDEFSAYKGKLLSLSQKITQIQKDINSQKIDQNNLILEENSLKGVQSSLYTTLVDSYNNIYNTNNSISSLGSKIASLQQDVQKLNNLVYLAQIKAQQSVNSSSLTETNNPQSSCNNGECSFQFTSYGYGNYIGMSQYGMLGMAQQGFNYQDIINHFYSNTTLATIANIDNKTVNVSGYGNMSFQNYLAGIGEIPNSWPQESIDAQVVISRTYALYYMDNCKCNNIPATGPTFQVYDGGTGKMQNVIATENQVIEYNGSPIDAFFSSSDGGYEENIGTIECVLWGNCNPTLYQNEYPYLTANQDPYDTASIDPNFEYSNPAMNSTQLINIVNTAQALCANVSNCYLFNNNDGTSAFDNAYTTDNNNTNDNNSTNDTFVNIDNYLKSDGITPINSITNFSISTMGNMPYQITVQTLHHTLTINSGVFWLAFYLVSPNYSNHTDVLVGFRYSVNIQ
jgi:SpoIID/LytB domain protein